MAHILVVDDEAPIREVLEGMLEILGHQVTLAGNGIEALACFDDGTYDLVLSDVMMPDMNGFDLLAELQLRTQGRVPVVILSSHDDPDDVEAAIFAGAFDYLCKPFDPKRVAQVLTRALGENQPHPLA